MNLEKNTQLVKSLAKELGFSFCGISKAGFLEEEAPRLERWLNRNMHGEMSYMANHFDKRLDPTLLVPGARSVVSLLFNYFPEKNQNNTDVKISKYAYGEDYHKVVKDRLHVFVERIREKIGDLEGRAFVDSAPVLDKAWARKSGIGWIGKNANLINKGHGSFFFIAELIIDLDLIDDSPSTDHCGTCTACIDACPTEAIVEPYVVDGSKCISYLTIELKNAIPEEFKSKMDHWVFGCDVCQDVCPWNRFSKPHRESRFEPHEEIMNFNRRDWMELTEDVFKNRLKKSPLQRAGYMGLIKNLVFTNPD